MALLLSHSSTWHSHKLAQIPGERTQTLSLGEVSKNVASCSFFDPSQIGGYFSSLPTPVPWGLYQHWLQAVLCAWHDCICRA